MKFWEVVPYLIMGKEVRNTRWYPLSKIWVDKKKGLMGYFGLKHVRKPIDITTYDLYSDGWEVKEPKDGIVHDDANRQMRNRCFRLENGKLTPYQKESLYNMFKKNTTGVMKMNFKLKEDEFSDIKIEDVKKENIKEAVKIAKEERASKEIKLAKALYNTLVDDLDRVDRKIKKLTEEKTELEEKLKRFK